MNYTAGQWLQLCARADRAMRGTMQELEAQGARHVYQDEWEIPAKQNPPPHTDAASTLGNGRRDGGI